MLKIKMSGFYHQYCTQKCPPSFRKALALLLIPGFLQPALPAAVVSGGRAGSRHPSARAQLPARPCSRAARASPARPRRGTCPGTLTPRTAPAAASSYEPISKQGRKPNGADIFTN